MVQGNGGYRLPRTRARASVKPAGAEAGRVKRPTRSGLLTGKDKRLGTPDDIAEAVASPLARPGHWINGQVVYANGGAA